MTAILWPYKMKGFSKNTEKGIRIEIYRKEDHGITQNKMVSARYWKTSRREKKAGKKSNRKDCGKREGMETFRPLMHI
jgi:hypothetical protein